MECVHPLVAAASGGKLLLALLSFAAAATALAVPQLPPAADRQVDFVRDVQPIFAANCTSCHGADKQKGGYRLDDRTTALGGGDEHAPNIVPGNSAASPLIRFVAGIDPDVVMPKKGTPLTPPRSASCGEVSQPWQRASKRRRTTFPTRQAVWNYLRSLR